MLSCPWHVAVALVRFRAPSPRRLGLLFWGALYSNQTKRKGVLIIARACSARQAVQTVRVSHRTDSCVGFRQYKNRRQLDHLAARLASCCNRQLVVFVRFVPLSEAPSAERRV